MKINHTWKQGPAKAPKYIPIEQHEALLKITQNNAYDFAMQLCTEMAMLALAEGFGFGEKRITEFLTRLNEEINNFVDNVQWEFSSETLDMSCREREEKRPDLAYTLEELDQRIKKIVPAEAFKPYKARYGSFGGRGSWCE